MSANELTGQDPREWGILQLLVKFSPRATYSRRNFDNGGDSSLTAENSRSLLFSISSGDREQRRPLLSSFLILVMTCLMAASVGASVGHTQVERVGSRLVLWFKRDYRWGTSFSTRAASGCGSVIEQRSVCHHMIKFDLSDRNHWQTSSKFIFKLQVINDPKQQTAESLHQAKKINYIFAFQSKELPQTNIQAIIQRTDATNILGGAVYFNNISGPFFKKFTCFYRFIVLKDVIAYSRGHWQKRSSQGSPARRRRIGN